MAYNFDFKDNIVYGAEHINAIRTSLLTCGVIAESFESCKVVSDVDGVKVLPGQAIFNDGCRINIDSDGVVRALISGSTNYVYLFNNILAGVCEILVSTELPSGDAILLAEVDAEGNITDKRTFAQIKASDAERYITSFNADVVMYDTTGCIATVSLPKSNCSMIEFEMSFDLSHWVHIKIFPKEESHAIWRVANGAYECGNIMTFKCNNKNRSISFKVDGNTLELKLEMTANADGSTHKVNVCGCCFR